MHFPFVIFHLPFVIADDGENELPSLVSQAMTNGKWKMTKGN